MKDPGSLQNCATVRVHIPDHSKDKAAQAVKTATEKFIQQMMQSNIRAAK